MKKIIKLVTILAIFVMLPIRVCAKEKVNVYLFKREGCGFCANAFSFFTELSKNEEYQNYFNLVTKEVLNNKENSSLMEKTAKKLGVDIDGVPFIVIGEKYFEGYANSFDEQIKSAIKNAYENESKDVVASIQENGDDNSAAITILILLVVVCGVVFLIYMAKDSGDELQQEEIVLEKTTKETVMKKQPTTKKSTVKTTTAKKTQTKKTNTTKKSTTKSTKK